MSRCLLSIPPFGFRLQEDRGHAWCCLAVAPWHLAQSWAVPRANLTAGKLQCWEWDPGSLTLRWPAAFGIANPLPGTRSWVVCIKHSHWSLTAFVWVISAPHRRQDQGSENTKGCQPPCHMPPEQRERMGGLESWCKPRQRSLISNTWASFQRQVQLINLSWDFPPGWKARLDSKKYIHCHVIKQGNCVLGASVPCGQC